MTQVALTENSSVINRKISKKREIYIKSNHFIKIFFIEVDLNCANSGEEGRGWKVPALILIIKNFLDIHVIATWLISTKFIG